MQDLFTTLRGQIGRVFVGQDEVVEFVLYTRPAGGRVLIEGVPAWARRCSSARWPTARGCR